MKRPATTSKPRTGQRAEQRREPRHASAGEVWLLLADVDTKSGLKEVRGRLVDRSTSGFRAEHGFTGLTCGQVVRFRLEASSGGRARVAWTRILGERVESGFFIVP